MVTSRKGIELIKYFEGEHLMAYRCPAGIWTIGYGHTKGVFEGMSINKHLAEVFLLQDLRSIEKCINDTGLNINHNQFDALISLTYNIGISAFLSSTLLLKLKDNPSDYKTIKHEFMRWIYVKGTLSNGLRNRRTAEYNLYETDNTLKITI
ncbi:MAG: lysozyme [Bacteroidales bacterium]|jgi:lysozyme|nr:lysozyme [Bacteroidales bacterium]